MKLGEGSWEKGAGNAGIPISKKSRGNRACSARTCRDIDEEREGGG